MADRNFTAAAELFGLVLAGGSSLRMGTDKGRLEYHGESQVVWAERTLSSVCASTLVSVNDDQSQKMPYRDLPLIVDTESIGGPARGLLSAHARYPSAAWLVIGVDMPFLNAKTLTDLVSARDPRSLATCYARGEGMPEPLCAIWEPPALELLAERCANGDASLSRCLRSAATQLLKLPDNQLLKSINTVEEKALAERVLRDS